jgi:hypothetical protein
MKLPSGFNAAAVLSDSRFRQGLAISPLDGTSSPYLERWLADFGKDEVIAFAAEHGFLVLSGNAINPAPRRRLFGRQSETVWNERRELAPDARSLFFHRDYDFSGRINPDDTALVDAYLDDRFFNGILVLHYGKANGKPRSSAWTGAVDKRALTPVLLQIADEFEIPFDEQSLRSIAGRYGARARARGLDLARFEPLYDDLATVCIGYDESLQFNEQAIRRAAELLGGGVYWHKWPRANETLVVANGQAAHARFVQSPVRSDPLERMLVMPTH